MLNFNGKIANDNISFRISTHTILSHLPGAKLSGSQSNCDLDCYLDHSPKDAPITTGHSLFNITKGHIVVHRARKSRVYIAWRYEIHAIIGSLGTVRAQPRFWSHVKSMGDFMLLQITVI